MLKAWRRQEGFARPRAKQVVAEEIVTKARIISNGNTEAYSTQYKL
jgi:hypothetical protein